ncbi:DUF6492 family protein [Kineococcus sp. NPDC059986]|uniref:DUF6492 family protein n=1 Tax=Kineococcus sp. NPDC059986 TaxID=3155538 RepID=UPI0034502D2F
MSGVPVAPVPLSLLTVTYPAEFGLQRVQARSVERFVDPDLLDSVVVVVNSSPALFRRHATELLDAYGALAPRVRVVHRDEVARLPRTTGWRSQQVLKLLAARSLHAERVVVLDSKNHFTNRLRPDHFTTLDGRPRVCLTDYRNHPLRPNVERVLRYVGLPPAAHLPRFSSTVTPAVLVPELVRDLVRDVEARSGRAFAHEFIARDLTEFPLYAAWMTANGLPTEEVYDTSLTRSATVWPRACGAADVDEAFTRADAGVPVVGVHRRALDRMQAPAVAALGAQWGRRGLVDDVGRAAESVLALRAEQRRAAFRQRLGETPLAVRARIRRVLTGSGPPGPPVAATPDPATS